MTISSEAAFNKLNVERSTTIEKILIEVLIELSRVHYKRLIVETVRILF